MTNYIQLVFALIPCTAYSSVVSTANVRQRERSTEAGSRHCGYCFHEAFKQKQNGSTCGSARALKTGEGQPETVLELCFSTTDVTETSSDTRN